MTSWRLQQVKQYGNDFVIKQDHALIDFAKTHQVKTLVLQSDPDLEYFSSMLPECQVVAQADSACMLAIIGNHFKLNFEEFLSNLDRSIQHLKPKWIYVAVNKYFVITQQSWPNLTNDYDADLLNFVASTVQQHGFKELTRTYNHQDDGSYFNFAHPTTNAYYESIR